MTKFVTPFNGLSKRVSLDFKLPSLTDQSSSFEADIGFIIENFVRTGQLPQEKRPQFVDCTSVQSFEDSLAIVSEVKTQFELLPAKERDQFKTVSKWLEFINDPSNLDVCVERGYLANTKPVETPVDLSTGVPTGSVLEVNKTSQSGVDTPSPTN